MSISYVETGRTRQKTRTQQALVAAVRGLIAAGETPTVEQAADAAGVSRATAYRYFPQQRALLLAAYPELEAESLLGSDAPHDAGARVDLVVDQVTGRVVESENELRTQLRLSLEPDERHGRDLVLRQGRVIRWLEDALRPAARTLSKTEMRQLVYAIRCSVGIEALVWLCDVAGLSREDAVDVMRWSARALFRTAMADARSKQARGRTSRATGVVNRKK